MDMTFSAQELQDWADKKEIKPTDRRPGESEKMDVLRLLYTYKDPSATDLRDLPATELIQHRVLPREDTKPHNTKNRQFTHDKEWWIRKIVQEGMECGKYEKTATANGRLS
jgi:hypothetical protein